MQSFRLTIAALAAVAAFGTAHAGEDTEVVVVKAERPAERDMPDFVAIEVATPDIDFTEIAIEAPTIEPSDMKPEPERTELAMRETSETRT